MADDERIKKWLTIAAVVVVVVGACVALAVVFTGVEEPGAPFVEPAPAAEAEAGFPDGEYVPSFLERAPAAEVEAAAPGAAASAPAPAPAREAEPVEGALVELRFKDLAGFLRLGAQVADEVSPGAGERAVAMLAANVGGNLDWLGEGPALLVVRKRTEKGLPVAASVPVRDADAFLRVLESLVGAREPAEGGVVRFLRPGAEGGADLEVFALVADGRAAVGPDRELLREFSRRPQAPEEDLRLRVDLQGLGEAYMGRMLQALAGALRRTARVPPRQLQMGLMMTGMLLQSMDDLTVALRIDENELVCVTSSTAGEGSLVDGMLGLLVPLGGPDELKWLPVDCSMTSAFGIDGEKLDRAVAGPTAPGGGGAPAAEAPGAGAARRSAAAVGVGPGGTMAMLAAMRVRDGEKVRKRLERAFSREVPLLGVGKMTLSYTRGARKAGEVEVDRARVDLATEREELQAFSAIFAWMLECDFAFPPGTVLACWGMDRDRILDAAVGRPAAGEGSLADSAFYGGLPEKACAAGEVYGVRCRATVMGVASVFGQPVGDLSAFTKKDVPYRFVSWKEGRTLHSRLTAPRAALRLYGEALRALRAGAPAGGEDIGF